MINYQLVYKFPDLTDHQRNIVSRYGLPAKKVNGVYQHSDTQTVGDEYLPCMDAAFQGHKSEVQGTLNQYGIRVEMKLFVDVVEVDLRERRDAAAWGLPEQGGVYGSDHTTLAGMVATGELFLTPNPACCGRPNGCSPLRR